MTCSTMATQTAQTGMARGLNRSIRMVSSCQSTQMPTGVVDEALDECSTIPIKDEREGGEKSPTTAHLNLVNVQCAREAICGSARSALAVGKWRARQDSNLWPPAPEAGALSS